MYNSILMHPIPELLTDQNQPYQSSLSLLNGYDRTKKWTKYVDLFKKKIIIMPINENKHWSLGIINNP